jgi:hypothetical protein
MDIYKEKTAYYDHVIRQANAELKNLSLYRLVTFIVSIALIIILANQRQLIPVLILTPVCVSGFALLLNQYNTVYREKQQAVFLKEINQAELLRQENKLSGFPTGQSFADRDHNYVSDLDIFGPHSLFQLINRTTTESGQALLASWLSQPAPKAEVIGRQRAVQELVPSLEWRQDFQAAGMWFDNKKSDYARLINWIEEPLKLSPDKTKHLVYSISLALLATLAAGYFVHGLIISVGAFSFKFIVPLIIALFVNSRFAKQFKPVAEEIIENTQNNIQTLGGYQSLITGIESANFQSDRLRALQSTFRDHQYSAAHEMNRLKRILEIFQQKGTSRSVGTNAFYGIFNSLWNLDVYLILLAEDWKTRNAVHVRSWAAAVSELEVLSSLAGFAYSNPGFTFPEIADEPYVIQFDEIGHPLLPSRRRVANSFHLNGRGNITMITGSNMAGKSTFLRTIGTNLTLALMGAPCCAKSSRVSLLKVFTSMRTQDNLEEGVSSFYAELKKIRQLLTLIESGEAIFFMLDEMFKGTNSEDRYKGGVSLIKQLSELNAFGIISTHDLDLARLAGKHMIVSNFSFNSEIKEGEMIFNYKLTEDICKDFNASELMRKSGIRILENVDEIR